MPRAIWKGSISFGLVQIPVGLYSAVERDDLSFTMLDSRDFGRVGYERVNKESGEPVPWSEIVKGYEHAKGEYVILTDEDFKYANVEATQTVDIEQFVDEGEIDPRYFDKPYYLAPEKKGKKAYALLRQTLKDTGKVGIAKVVIRTRQHLAAVMVREDVLVLEILRFEHELRDASNLDLPESGKKLDVSKPELDMAKQLVEGLAGRFDPGEHRDVYREDLMRLIDEKVEAGEVNVITEYGEEWEGEEPRERAEGVDLMSLLKQSVSGQKGAGRRKSRGKKQAARAAKSRSAKSKATKSKSKRKSNTRSKSSGGSRKKSSSRKKSA